MQKNPTVIANRDRAVVNQLNKPINITHDFEVGKITTYDTIDPKDGDCCVLHLWGS